MTVAGLLTQIAAIGRDAGSGGYRRFAFTAEDATLGEWFAASCAARGLQVTVDRCGNQWAWWGDPDAAGPGGGVVTGSHLDSVPDGGGYDGPLGVACALAAVDLLQSKGFRPQRPIGVVRFLDEEGARFGLACSGSRLVTGSSDPGRVLGLTDAGGTRYGDAMAAAGLAPQRAGRDDETLRRVGAFVELHVEQGRGLALAEGEPGAPEGGGAAVGVASAIRPHGRWRVDLAGTADHAGTTALADRDDPMLALARLVLAVRAAAEAGADRSVVGTVGKVAVLPNAVNAVPSLVQAWLDVRADREDQVRAVLAELESSGFRPVEESWTGAVVLDAALRDRLAATVGAALAGKGDGAALAGTADGAAAAADGAVASGAAAGGGRAAPVLPTGAGHDAGILAAAGIPSGMLFVRNPTGVSHSPAEHAPDGDCEAGAVALAAVLADLAGPVAAGPPSP